ncbi:MAG: DUF4838 domain-containing protein [Planctomycetota bacterium]|nr:DUF4838 domain-containing protein [Planctomycetota bacterium]
MTVRNLCSTILIVLFLLLSLCHGDTQGHGDAQAANAWHATSEHPPAIICKDNAAEPVKFAATELRRYLGKILGHELPEGPEAASSPRIHIAVDTKAGLSEEGYEFRVEGPELRIIGGGPLGVVFGGYEFLRRYGGCRFSDLGPDGEYVPHKNKIAIYVKRQRREPKLRYRGLQFSYGEDEELNRARIDWMAKNGLNYVMYRPAPQSYDPAKMVHIDPATGKIVWPKQRVVRYGKRWFDQELRPAVRKRGMKLDMNHHNLCYWLPPSRYAAEHPQWYAKVDGHRTKKFKQLCICTSNKRAVDALVENVRKYLRDNPEVKVLGIIPEDGVGMCQCDACLAGDPDPKEAFRKPNYNRENRSKSSRYHKLLNAVAEGIAEEFPDVTVGGAAYVDLLWPGRDVKFRPNETLWFALYWRDGSRPISGENTSPKNKFFYDVLRKWKDVFPGRLIVYTYYMGMGAQCTLTYPQSKVICEDWKNLKRMGIEGGTVQSWTHNHSAYALNNLVFARCGWSDDVDHDEVLDEYLLGTFGTAGEELRPIFLGLTDALDKLAADGGTLSPNADNVRYFLKTVGREKIHRALRAAEAKAGTDRERRQVKKLATAVRYWEMAAEILELRAQAHKIRKKDPKRAAALLDRAVNELWPKMQEYMDKQMPPGWLDVNTPGNWKKTINRMKREKP